GVRCDACTPSICSTLRTRLPPRLRAPGNPYRLPPRAVTPSYMLDTVLFEFDGVLADTADARRDAVLSALHADGVELSEAEYREACAGLALDDAIRAAFDLHVAPSDASALALATLRAERTYRAYLGKGVMLVEGTKEVI